MTTLICARAARAARSCLQTQTSLSRSVIGSASPPGGGSEHWAGVCALAADQRQSLSVIGTLGSGVPAKYELVATRFHS